MGQSVGRLKPWWGLATTVGLFVLALLSYRTLLSGVPKFMPGDHHAHLLFALGTSVEPVPHPLFHYAVTSMMVLTRDQGFAGARRCAVLVLALAVAWRGWLTYRELSDALAPPEAFLACVGLAVAIALPWWESFPTLYLGQIHPNVWHNPTAVFAAPLAMLTFLSATRDLAEPGLGKALGVGVWSALCALAKPNYLLAFFPCFGPLLLAVVAREVWGRRLSASGAFTHVLAAFAPPAWVLIVQYFYTFGGEISVTLAPLAVWRSYSSNIPASVLRGLAFPCAAAACYPREMLKDRKTLLSWCVLAVAVAQFAVLAEQPEGRFYSANFGWGMMPACYLLFVESCRLVGGQRQDYRKMACSGVLALHAAAGTFYLMRCLAEPGNSQKF